ncbi:arylesterase [Congregibacter variabilis]|uniref:Arylesterase n=1 Tax=Congregibacter variabilis TaxID=3081200 RepID=A0ABZ0I582_9GAMM|nr:arylesterase [Congregibacter sp. IMCC43200]
MSWPVSATDASEITPRVLVLGDSISAAYGMSLEQGWTAILERQLRGRWSNSFVINASISGDTSAGGLRRLPSLLTEHAPDLLVIELGGNDGLRGYPTTKLESNLTRMAELAKAAGAAVLILPMEIPPNYGPRYTRAFRESFRRAADATGSTLGPFILDGIATDPSLMQQDGIHPTVEAQPLIKDILLPVIESLLARSELS